jgi:hypothetical protein
MNTPSFDEISAIGIDLGVIGVKVDKEFVSTEAEGSFTGQSIFCYIARDNYLNPETIYFKKNSMQRERPSVSDKNSYKPDQLFVLALWSDGGRGRNTTGEGKEGVVSPEEERNLMVSIEKLINKDNIRLLNIKESLIHDIMVGKLEKAHGKFIFNIDTPLREAHYYYEYEAVNLIQLINWLIENKVVDE